MRAHTQREMRWDLSSQGNVSDRCQANREQEGNTKDKKEIDHDGAPQNEKIAEKCVDAEKYEMQEWVSCVCMCVRGGKGSRGRKGGGIVRRVPVTIL